MTRTLDLDAYFARVGYSGPRVASLDTLQALHWLHAHAIPFENLNPWLGWPVPLDPLSLERKLIAGRRGGYCFEHNLLFSDVLRGLGFDVTWLAARVTANTTLEGLPARTHMLLLVQIDGVAWVADVGFGGLTLTSALRLASEGIQPTPHEMFRLAPFDDEFLMEARLGDAWSPLYRFGLQRQMLADYEITNWYLSNHPESKFVTNLIAARPDADRRYALRNNVLSVHHLGGPTERQVFADAASLRNALERHFRISLPDTPLLTAKLERLVAEETAPSGTV